MAKIYDITNFNNGVECTVHESKDKSYELVHVGYHSPTGFNVGYGGSGPADLALSILADHFDESDRALKDFECECWAYYQKFKWDLISKITFADLPYQIESDIINKWLYLQIENEPKIDNPEI